MTTTKNDGSGSAVQPIVRRFEPFDLVFALNNAAEFLEMEEWPDPDDAAQQESANREAAKRIRKMAKRIKD